MEGVRSFLVYLLRWFGCSAYEDDKKYLTIDSSILCQESIELGVGNEKYDLWSPIITVFSFAFVVGIPGFYLFMLLPVRKIVKPKTKPGFNKLDKQKEQLRLRDRMVAIHKAVDAFFNAKDAEEKEEVLQARIRPLVDVKAVESPTSKQGEEAEQQVSGPTAPVGHQMHPLKRESVKREKIWGAVAQTLRGLRTEQELCAQPESDSFLKEQHTAVLRVLVTMQRANTASHEQLVKQYALEEKAMQMAFLWAGYMPKYW